jgi:hypothetical protein
MPTRFSTAVILSSQYYQANLSPNVQIGDLARYLSRVEPNLDASTLEFATRIAWDQNLQSINLQSGERLLVFGAEPPMTNLPLLSGDKFVTFANNHFRASSGGKRSLLVGKSGEGQPQDPDIDLRQFISNKVIDYISRNCLTLNYTPDSNWHIVRTGSTRVRLDELELGAQPIPLRGKHRLRFYRASDTQYNQPALAEIEINVETIGNGTGSRDIEQGGMAVKVRIGLEINNQLLRASEKLSIQQVMEALARHTKITLPADAQVYQTRILSPKILLQSLFLSFDSENFLYTSLYQQRTQYYLTLRDAQDPTYEVRVTLGMADEVKTFGCRLHPDYPDQSLDIDLFDLMARHGFDPQTFKHDHPLFGQLEFDVPEKLWHLKVNNQSKVSVLLNNVNIKNGVAVPIISGDVISVMGDLYQQISLEVEIGNKNQ